MQTTRALRVPMPADSDAVQGEASTWQRRPESQPVTRASPEYGETARAEPGLVARRAREPGTDILASCSVVRSLP